MASGKAGRNFFRLSLGNLFLDSVFASEVKGCGFEPARPKPDRAPL